MQKTNIKANFIYNAIFQLSNILIPIVTTPYLTRILHAHGVGEYAYFYSIAYYFYLFSRLGLHNYGNRSIAYAKDDKEMLSKTFWDIYAFQLFMGSIMSIIYLLYCLLFSQNKGLSGIFLLVVMAGGIDLTWALYGLEEFKVSSIRDIITKVLTAICIFIFVKNDSDVWKYSLIYSMGFFVSQVVSIPVIMRRVSFIKPDFNGVLSHIKPNCVLFLPTIAVSIYKTMDKIMLGAMSNETELGYYHSSENIVMVPLALITALGTVMLPRMSNLLSQNKNNGEIKNIFDKSIAFAMFISTSICSGIMAVSNEFVPLFFGQGFEKCISIFYIVLPSCVFLAFANVIRTQYLLPRKKDKLFIISLFSGAGMNLLLNMLLIPKYASVGAAVGTLFAEATVCVVQSAFVFNEANIGRNITNSIPFVIAGGLMFVVFRNFSIVIGSDVVALGLKIIICGVFYMVVLGGIFIFKNIVVYRTS